MQSRSLQALIPLTVKQLKDATQDHPDGACAACHNMQGEEGGFVQGGSQGGVARKQGLGVSVGLARTSLFDFSECSRSYCPLITEERRFTV